MKPDLDLSGVYADIDKLRKSLLKNKTNTEDALTGETEGVKLDPWAGNEEKEKAAAAVREKVKELQAYIESRDFFNNRGPISNAKIDSLKNWLSSIHKFPGNYMNDPDRIEIDFEKKI